MLTLLTFPEAFDEPTATPFGAKVMALLRMSGLPHQIDKTADPRKMPKKKLPVLRDGETLISDSADIRRHLEQAHGAEFDAGLNASEKAHAHALGRMVEEYLYFALVWNRWVNPDVWPQTKAAFFSSIPLPLRLLVPGLVRRQITAAIDGQGIGRHTGSEIAERAGEDCEALATTLGDKTFLFGERPTAIDASAGPMLSFILTLPESNGLHQQVVQRPSLVSYVHTVRQTLYPEPE